MSTAKKLMGTTATGNVGAWDLSYAYHDNPNGWDISTAVFKEGHYVSSQETEPRSISFSADGMKIYVMGVLGDDINEYSVTVPWTFSGFTYTGSAYVGNHESNPNGLFFKPDGTKMYIVGSTSDAVHEYSLSTAWATSTAVYVQSFSVAPEEAASEGLFFKPDGRKMYVIGSNGDDINEYSLSTAWDISTASYFQNFSVAAQESNPNGLFFKPDGTKMYVIGSTGDDVNEYSLSTAWDISTASYFQNFSVATEDTSPEGLFFKPDGAYMYVIGSANDILCRYKLASGFSVAAQDTNPQDIIFHPDGTKMFVLGDTGDAIYQYSLSTAWDVSTATYVQNFYVGTQDDSVFGFFFKPDGTKMYVIGLTTDAVYEYSLSAAWDVSTATYVQNFSVVGQEGVATGLFFHPDGTKMYVVGVAGKDVNEYSLSTAWDVTTATYVQNFSVVAQDSSPHGLFFKPDGTKMYVVGTSNDAVYEYSLSTAWDVSTATYVQTFYVATEEAAPSGLFFHPDGTKMYVVGYTTDSIYSYTLGVQ